MVGLLKDRSYCFACATAAALEVEREQAREDFLVGDIGRPAVGVEDGIVEFAMGEGQPCGALVVQVGERALQACAAWHQTPQVIVRKASGRGLAKRLSD